MTNNFLLHLPSPLSCSSMLDDSGDPPVPYVPTRAATEWGSSGEPRLQVDETSPMAECISSHFTLPVTGSSLISAMATELPVLVLLLLEKKGIFAQPNTEQRKRWPIFSWLGSTACAVVCVCVFMCTFMQLCNCVENRSSWEIGVPEELAIFRNWSALTFRSCRKCWRTPQVVPLPPVAGLIYIKIECTFPVYKIKIFPCVKYCSITTHIPKQMNTSHFYKQ